MLRAFVDESYSDGPPVYVLGGYLASAKSWIGFSDRWQSILDVPPKIEYFKMSEAANLSGQFYGWSEDRRDERLGWLYSVIEEFVDAAFAVMFRIDEFKETQTNYGKAGQNPYYFATANMGEVARRFHIDAGVNVPIDFVFDNQMMEKAHVMAGWDWAANNVPMEPPSLRNILLNPPAFMDDKTVLALQAADLHAWWQRKRYVELITGAVPLPFPWVPKRDLLTLTIAWNKDQLREHNAKSLEIAKKHPGAPESPRAYFSRKD